jgi:hypothetical protein
MTFEQIWHAFEKEYSVESGRSAGPVSEVDIQEAERKIKCTFDNGYKKYLRIYGGGIGGPGYYIYGLRYQRSLDNTYWSVIQNTNFYKNEQKWPGIEDWYIISDDGRGNPIGMNPKGEVWLSDHDAGFEQIKLADSFEEFIWRIHNDTLYEDEP